MNRSAARKASLSRVAANRSPPGFDMDLQKTKHRRQLRRRQHVRRHIVGSSERPRLSVFRSSKHIYAQLIDDLSGVTLAAASSRSKEDGLPYGGNVKAAKVVGKKLAEAAKA